MKGTPFSDDAKLFFLWLIASLLGKRFIRRLLHYWRRDSKESLKVEWTKGEKTVLA